MPSAAAAQATAWAWLPADQVTTPRCFSSARATGDLGDELEGALGSAEIGQRQRRIAADHADERDVRIVEPLGDHLRAEHHLKLAAPKSAKRLLVILAAAHRVAIDTRVAKLRELPRELLFDADRKTHV